MPVMLVLEKTHTHPYTRTHACTHARTHAHTHTKQKKERGHQTGEWLKMTGKSTKQSRNACATDPARAEAITNQNDRVFAHIISRLMGLQAIFLLPYI